MIFTLYRTSIRPEDNCVVEEISKYLEGKTVYKWDDLKYTQPELDIIVKVPLSGHIQDLADFNYASLTDSESDKTYYYFVIDAAWKAHQTLRLQLSIDSLNTFWDEIGTSLTPETRVTRRYFDRWRKSDGKLYPLIDRHPEDITAPTLLRSGKPSVLGGEDHWTLVYMTQYNQSENLSENPTNCFAFPENAVNLYDSSSSASPTITNESFADGTVLVMDYDHNKSASISYEGLASYTIDGPNKAVAFLIGAAGVSIRKQTGENAWDTTIKSSVTIKNATAIYKQPSNFTIDVAKSLWQFSDPVQIQSSQLMPFSTWYASNKTDPRLIKIIELPYAPFQAEFKDGNKMVVPDGWELFGAGYLRLSDPSKKFHSEIGKSKLGPDARDASEVDTALLAAPMKYETKLWNSNYRAVKFIYDASAHAPALERFEQPTSGATDFSTDIYFDSGTGMDNSFAFQFDDSEKHTTDYGDWLICNRTTEIPYYTNEYLNYLRYGKAVDERNKAFGTASTVASGIGGTVSTSASLAFAISGAKLGALGGGFGAAIGAAVGLASAAIATASSIVKANDQINQKIDQYTHQASSVSVTSDVSVFREYGKNKLLMVSYAPDDEIEKSIANYFRLYGYGCDEFGAPEWQHRYWSDYFVIAPRFRPLNTWMKKYSDDIASRMQSGFRIFHRHEDYRSHYDFANRFENWEIDLV